MVKLSMFDVITFCTDDDDLTNQGSVHYLLSLNLPSDHQDPAEGQESIKSMLNAIRSKLVRQVRGGTTPC